MIAELHGKISSSGSNLNDRLEDNLTGDVFGSLRYLPFQMGMAQILKAARMDSLTACVEQSGLSFWGDRLRFWPYDPEGELDAILELDNAVVGIEVKYLSGLSSDDGADNADAEDSGSRTISCHQLARESRIVKKWCPSGKQAFLLFIARDSICARTCSDAQKRGLIEPGVMLGYVSWQEILNQLCRVCPDTPYQTQILNDLTSLLRRKDFKRFQNFALGNMPDIEPNAAFSFEYTGCSFAFTIPSIEVGEEYYEFG